MDRDNGQICRIEQSIAVVTVGVPEDKVERVTDRGRRDDGDQAWAHTAEYRSRCQISNSGHYRPLGPVLYRADDYSTPHRQVSQQWPRVKRTSTRVRATYVARREDTY